MLREHFGGHNPSHFLKVDPIVKTYIISECFLWSGWNFVTPIFAVFATTEITGGNVQIAASSFSLYLIVRVIFELITGRMISKASDSRKIAFSTIGIILMSCAYLGLSYAHDIMHLFLFHAVAGMGLGIASPAKNSLFATHLDKNKEASEWSISDAMSFISVALATSLGGFIAATYGFRVLFLIASLVNLAAIPPYLLYVVKKEPTSSN
jgi:MFS family permease